MVVVPEMTHIPPQHQSKQTDVTSLHVQETSQIFCLKEKSRAHYSQQTAMSFKDKTKQTTLHYS
jgi:hypothetical protein